ncbi:Checkpoint serine/threonine-protein kinase BUB1 [Madurella mycetomatis]|uniref:Checkpoint serine/threonine-protein kinase BUB1 n=1 Tax=Madurella mycetomatis TaxID=100816 RepID=A0A175W3R3_9PEZI|nr:Checkpoint serine/threonine-protein kinase BUB1 [Madurella mycetomatis]KXX78099.1 Checkpoint serine/threonine-protein kinase BUB1 [Madurella mycetomatis]
MASNDLIDFDVIEGHKENIQALPSGRSAKKLAELFSPSPLHPQSTPTPLDTKDVNDDIRAEFEAEIAAISESDDPLDIYDRYVRWTLDAYPSAQATPQSQLHTLLERATKTFVNSAQYKNDPRYLKMWLYYINFFSDAPRETFVFLSRHSIGETLALFYEEYAAWLEGAGRWAQAEEVYKLGIEREARPAARLLRKFGEFEQRRAQHGNADGPSSPALPAARPALAAKIDPFAAAAAAAARDPQAPRQTSGLGGQSSKTTRSKLTIFSDADAATTAPALSSRGAGSKGWESIGSLSDRKKENVMEPKPWVGETLKAGGKKSSGAKLAVFRDPSMARQLSKSHIPIHHTKVQVTVNPANGKRERVFVDLRAVYPTPDEPGTELSFEEIWAANRGWIGREWEDEVPEGLPSFTDENAPPDMNTLADRVSEKLVIHHDMVRLDENGAPVYPKEAKPRKKKVIEVNETQIIKAKLDSPSGPKIKKRRSMAEPTMTLHTKAATEDIYDIFNAPLKPAAQGIDAGDDERGYESDDYTSGAENEASDAKSVNSEWSEFSTRKHIPGFNEDVTERNDTQMSDLIDIHESAEATSEGEDLDEPPRTRTVFVPIPPEDYVPTRQPYRDPVEMANNRLPFMTPITERTETSLDFTLQGKTPSRSHDRDVLQEEDEEEDDNIDLSPLSSPLREVIEQDLPKSKISQPLLPKAKPASAAKPFAPKTLAAKGPIIKDAQCNPVDDSIRAEILANIQPPLSSYEGFYDHRNEKYEKGAEIRKFAKATGKGSRSSTDKAGNLGTSVVLEFPGTKSQYIIRKELGAGAFAPVYLVENSRADGSSSSENPDDENKPVAMMGRGTFASAHNHRHEREALKMEDPPTPWEFYIMRLAHSRLGPQHRATASLSPALELHLYQDEGFLFLPYYPHGTLLDVVNLFRGEAAGIMDEQLAMFFAVELLRTVEALHAKQILHGDIKADNCLLRLDPTDEPLSAQWRPSGAGGWSARGITLIDFGRGIDMRAFAPDTQFVADWKTSAQDCAEMREGRPWTWQIDYHGLAGTLHCLLFGKYIETARCDSGGLATAGKGGRRYKIRESLKRYWQTEIWAECFDVLLNPGAHVQDEDGGRMPVLKSMRGVREKMEAWLEGNCERGIGLRGLMGKVEGWARGRK